MRDSVKHAEFNGDTFASKESYLSVAKAPKVGLARRPGDTTDPAAGPARFRRRTPHTQAQWALHWA